MNQATNDEIATIVAYHEAGHALMRYIEQMPITKVSIIADDESLGRVEGPHILGEWVTWETGPKLQLRTERTVRVLVAGMQAEIIAGVEKTEQELHDGAAHDYHVAIDLLDRLCGGHDAMLETYLKLMELQAAAILGSAKYRPCLDDLARALIDHRALSGPRVRAVIRESFAKRLRRATSSIPKP